VAWENYSFMIPKYNESGVHSGFDGGRRTNEAVFRPLSSVKKSRSAFTIRCTKYIRLAAAAREESRTVGDTIFTEKAWSIDKAIANHL
jgi:hypothetical protein